MALSLLEKTCASASVGNYVVVHHLASFAFDVLHLVSDNSAVQKFQKSSLNEVLV
jgi:hypothetical protein